MDTVEHPSTTQTTAQMNAKGADMQAKLAAIGKSGGHETRSTGTAIEGIEGVGGKALGTAGALISLPGALMDAAKDPNMSTIEFLYRAFGAYDLGVASGQLPPPPPQP